MKRTIRSSCFPSLLPPYMSPSVSCPACITTVPYRHIFAVTRRHTPSHAESIGSLSSSQLIAYGRPAPLVERRGGERGGRYRFVSATIAQHRTRVERNVPLSCISRLPSYLVTGCDIVFIVERERRNPQVRNDFPNG